MNNVMTEQYGTAETKPCKCIAQLKESLKNAYAVQLTDKDATEIKVELAVAFTICKDGKMRSTTMTESKVSWVIKGKTKKITNEVVHSYCPFCGQKNPE